MPYKTLINVIPYHEATRYKRITYVQCKKACGRKNCRTCEGVQPRHGPYWYLITWDPSRHKQRTVYIGKQLPAEAAAALRAKQCPADLQAASLHQQVQTLRDELVCCTQEKTSLQEQLRQVTADLQALQTRRRRDAA